MIKSFSIIYFICLTHLVFSQQMGLEWAMSMRDTVEMGGQILTIAQDSDSSGNTYVTGIYDQTADFDPSSNESVIVSSSSESNIFLSKYSNQGNLVWVIDLGGYHDDYVNDIHVDKSGNITLVGSFIYAMNYDPNDRTVTLEPFLDSPTESAYILRIDSNGNFVWVQRINSIGYAVAQAVDVSLDGSVYVTGKFYEEAYFYSTQPTDTIFSSGAGDYDIFLAKFSTNGETIWAKSMGGDDNDEGVGISVDHLENVNLLAIARDTIDLDPSDSSYIIDISYFPSSTYNNAGNIIAQYDSLGTLNWCYLSPILLTEITMDLSDNISVIGYNGSATTDFDPGPGVFNLSQPSGGFGSFITKYNMDGNFLWATTVGTNGFRANEICISEQDSIFVGGIIQTGWSSSLQYHLFFSKYGSNGNGEIINTLNCNNPSPNSYQPNFSGLSMTTGNRPVISGNLRGSIDADPGAGNYLIAAPTSQFKVSVLATYETSGNPLWVIRYGDNDDYAAPGLGTTDFTTYTDLDQDDNVYVTGKIVGPVDFDPSNNNAVLNGTTGTVFLAKYDSLANHQWAFNIASLDVEKVMVDTNLAMCYLIGEVYGTSDFDPSVGSALVSSTDGAVGIVAAYNLIGDFQSVLELSSLAPMTSSSIQDITMDNSGNYFIAGTINGSVDFDFSSAIFPVNSSNHDIFLAKYDPMWNLIWVKVIEVTVINNQLLISVNSANEIFITGTCWGNFDLDPSANTYPIVTTSQDIFLAKYSPIGDFIWGGIMSGPGIDNPRAIRSGNNCVYIAGNMTQTLDVGVSGTNYELIAEGFGTGTNQSFLTKYNASNAQLEWAFNYVDGQSKLKGMDIDDHENIFLSGQFETYSGLNTGLDIDPSLDTFALYRSTQFDYNLYLAKYDSSGTLLWGTSLPVMTELYSSIHNGNDLALTKEKDAILSGNFEHKGDFAPSSAFFEMTSFNHSSPFLARYSNCQQTIVSDTVHSCGTYTWNTNQVLSSSGTYVDTFSTIQGCDSVVNLVLTVQPLHTTFESISVCDTFIWSNGVSYSSSGTYYYVVSDINGCDSTLQLNLDITPFDTSISLLNDSTLSANNNQADSYQWVECDNNYSLIVGETNQSIVLQTNGSYAVILTQNNCSDTSECYVIDNLQTPELFSIIPITIFPNPTSGNIKVDLSQTVGNLTIHVLDVAGRNILEQTVLDVEEFDVSLPNESGVYFICVDSVECGIYRTFKVVKK